jgi:hypothetical protein
MEGAWLWTQRSVIRPELEFASLQEVLEISDDSDSGVELPAKHKRNPMVARALFLLL